MSGQEINDKRTFQAYAQLPYKPFQFLEPTEQLNLRLVGNIDPDQLYYRGDLDQASAVLKNFVNSSIPEEMDYEMFNKLFRLSQLAIEYYSQEQAQRQSTIDEQYLQYKQLQEQEINLAELKVKHNTKKDKYMEMIKSLNLKIKEMKKEAEKVGSYKCVYCSKAYRDKDGLDSHVKRRHLDMINEIQETKDMLKERQDPIYHLKKKQQEEIREQNKVQLERLQQLQKQLEQSKINENKLVEQISNKLKQDFDLKISQVVQMSNDETQKEQERSAKKQKEFQEKESQSMQKDQIVNESLVKMTQNLDSFQKAFQKIQEAQEKLNQQQEEYSKQLQKISENQEDLKKSQLQQQSLLKESGYSGNIVSNKTAPLPLHLRQNSKQDSFPVQPAPTADFSREGNMRNRQFFNQGYEDDDSFLNNNSAVIDEQQLSKIRESNVKSGFQPKQFHIGDLEDDVDSQDENRKAFKKYKEEEAIKNQIMSQIKNDISGIQTQKSQPYLYQDPQDQSVSEQNDKEASQIKKHQTSSISLNAIADFEHKSQISETNIKEEKQKTDPKQNLMKKLQEYEEEDIDEEESNYFQQQKSEASDTPRQPNVLSNQMSFGVKFESQSEQNLTKKSTFGVQKDKSYENKMDILTIKEQPSKEQQKSLVIESDQENDKKDKKSKNKEGDKKKKDKKEKKNKSKSKSKSRSKSRSSSSSSSSSSSDSSQSSLSDISERMKSKKKDKHNKKENKQSKQSSKRSIGNEQDIPSPQIKEKKDSKEKEEKDDSKNKKDKKKKDEKKDKKTKDKKDKKSEEKKKVGEENDKNYEEDFEDEKEDKEKKEKQKDEKKEKKEKSDKKLKKKDSMEEKKNVGEVNDDNYEDDFEDDKDHNANKKTKEKKDKSKHGSEEDKQKSDKKLKKKDSHEQKSKHDLEDQQEQPKKQKSRESIDKKEDKNEQQKQQIKSRESIDSPFMRKQSQDSSLKKQLSNEQEKKKESNEQLDLEKIQTLNQQQTQSLSHLASPPIIQTQKMSLFGDITKTESIQTYSPIKSDNGQNKEQKFSRFGQQSDDENDKQIHRLPSGQQIKLNEDESNKDKDKKSVNEIPKKPNEPQRSSHKLGSQSSLKNEEEEKKQQDKKQGSQQNLSKKPSQEKVKEDNQPIQNKFSVPPINKNNDIGFDFYRDSPRNDQISANDQDLQIANQLLSVNQNSDDDLDKKKSTTQPDKSSTIGRHQVKHEEKKVDSDEYKPFGNSEIDDIRRQLNSQDKNKNKFNKLDKKDDDFSDDDEIERDSFSDKKNDKKIAGAFDAIEDDDF